MAAPTAHEHNFLLRHATTDGDTGMKTKWDDIEEVKKGKFVKLIGKLVGRLVGKFVGGLFGKLLGKSVGNAVGISVGRLIETLMC